MTDAPDVPALAVADLDEAVQALRAAGLRVTTPRRLVIEALFEAVAPVSAAELAGRLRLDESSLYRNLEVLEQHGLARHLHLGHGPGLYVLAGRDSAEYLYCEACARVVVAARGELDPVRAQIRERFGYTVRFTHFAIVGLCAECSQLQATCNKPHRH
jgi:Fur family transcriptional regulator, ferric uptake regulator